MTFNDVNDKNLQSFLTNSGDHFEKSNTKQLIEEYFNAALANTYCVSVWQNLVTALTRETEEKNVLGTAMINQQFEEIISFS